MKQFSFTKLGRSLILALVAVCFVNFASAQVNMDGTNATWELTPSGWVNLNAPIEIDCDGDLQEFADDGGRLWNYNEDAPTRIWTFCPDDANQLINLEFTMWDVGTPTGDLEETAAYGFSAESILGNDFFSTADAAFKKASNGDLIDEDGTSSNRELFTIWNTLGETGVPDAPNGGKLGASCDNGRGCISILFNPENHATDGEVGAGWVFKATCEKRPSKITAPADASAPSVSLLSGVALCSYQAAYPIGEATLECVDACVSTDNIRIFFFPTPTLAGLGADTGSPYVEGGTAYFTPVLDALTNGEAYFNPYTGCWTYYAFFIVDANCDGDYEDDLLCENFDVQEITICPPPLACNDDIRLAVNSGCVGKVTPDMVLEDPCVFDLVNYDLYLYDENDNLIPNATITIAHIGTTVKAVVADKNYLGINDLYLGNNCWTNIHVEDNWQPYVDCPEDAAIFCGEDDGNINDAYDVFGYGIDKLLPSDVYDNCGNFEIDVTDWKFTAKDCSEDRIRIYQDDEKETELRRRGYNVTGMYTRTYTISDPVGNHSRDITCEQKVYVVSPRVNKPYNVDLECGDDTSPEGILASEGAEYAGYYYYQPRYKKSDLLVSLVDSDHAACGYAITYIDARVDNGFCGGTYKIFRTWSIYNWCKDAKNDYDGVRTYTQVIHVKDTKAPVIACPTGTIELGTSSTRCEAVLTLTAPNVSDDCSDIAEIWTDILDADKNAIASGLGPHVLAPGTYYARFIATDDCGNVSKPCLRKITVEDNDEPVCIVDEYTVVRVDDENHGAVTICADNLDSGSYDNCELDRLVIKKMNDPASVAFANCITLSCDDIFTDELDNAHDAECPGTVLVRFRAYDVNGLYSECMVEVELQDKIDPIIVGGPDKNVTCEVKDPYSLFNTPVATDNCDKNPSVELIREVGSFDSCGNGSVTRTWEATDACGNKAQTSQTVTSTHVSDYVVTFPADIDEECVGNDYEFDASDVIVSDDDCENILIRHSDKVYTGVEDACYKIIRTIEVINWCAYDVLAGEPSSSDDTRLSARKFRDGGDGYIKYVQQIIVKDFTAPVIEDHADVVIDDQTDGCEGLVTLDIDASDACTGAANLSISWRIDAFYGTAKEIAGIAEGTGASVTDVFPYGTHRITFWVQDGCGNTAEEDYLFTIRDRKKPGIVCVTFLSAELMPIDTDGDNVADNGMAEVWASEYVQSYSDNCEECEDKCFLIEDITATGETGATPGADAADVLAFTCDDLGSRRIAVWAKDAAGNWDVCTAFLELQNNMGACGDAKASIAVAIQTEMNQDVEGARVDITGMDAAYTDIAGALSMLAPVGGNYTVSPELNEGHLNGVSTRDIVMISQHILGSREFTSPYQLIAADANNSSNVTVSDMSVLRRLILNRDTEFQNNTSWRFVDKSYDFNEPTNPWAAPFSEVVTINGLSADAAANFIGVKIGDVDGNAVGAQPRNAVGTMTFNANDAEIAAGQEYTVEFTSADLANVAGYQFTMAFDQSTLEFIDVEAGALAGLTESNFGLTRVDEGVITTSYNTNDLVANDDVLFSVTFIAKSDVTLSEAISVNSRYISSEAYDANLSTLDVAIEFGTTVVAEGFELYQNAPNPFQTETRIGFNLSEAGAATMTIMDISGKTLKVINGEYTKGYNEVTLNRSELSGAGVLYYQLNTANNSATRKMIIVE